jgi:hypothetical protein
MIGAQLALASFLCATAAQGQYFLDDFEDGNLADGAPATWLRYAPPFDQGGIEVVDGSLVLTPLNSGPPTLPDTPRYWEVDAYLAEHLYHDVNVRTQVRALGSGPSVAGLTVLDTEATLGPDGLYVGGDILTEGSNRRLRLHYSAAEGSAQMGSHTIAFTHLDDEVNLRLMVKDRIVSLTAWVAGEPEPRPQLLGRLPLSFSHHLGHIAAYAGNRETAVPVAFRFIEVSPVPEPATLMAAAVSGLGLFGGRRRRTGAICRSS